MPRIVWDKAGDRFYETGVDRGVLYVANAGVYGAGIAWNGLVSVSENPTGAEMSPQYADNIKYLNLQSIEEFEFNIEAFFYPPEFGVCDGSAELEEGLYIGQQSRSPFGFSYRTLIGSDTLGTEAGYKIHLIYDALAKPSQKARNTVNDTPEAMTFSWDCTTTPVQVTNHKPTAFVTIDSTKWSPADLVKLENLLYGDDTTSGKLPMPDEIISLMTV